MFSKRCEKLCKIFEVSVFVLVVSAFLDVLRTVSKSVNILRYMASILNSLSLFSGAASSRLVLSEKLIT